MKPRLPDLIIAGAPRSGTTWLHQLLDRHPDVYMAKPIFPEPKFFLVDQVYERGLEYYSETWFSDAGSARIAGEKTTNYLENPIVPLRIYKDLPAVKLVFILREPAARAYSNYLWSRMHGHEHEDFGTALALEQDREALLPTGLRYARPHAYFSRGLYADLLRPYFERFPREHISCLRFEDISSEPASLAERLYSFLDIEGRPQDVIDLGVINASKKEIDDVMPDGVREQLLALYAEPNRRLGELLGPDFELW